MEIDFARAFKPTTPSLGLISRPLKLIDTINAVVEDRLLFSNKDSYFWLVYPSMLDQPLYKKITGRITVKGLFQSIIDAYDEALRFTATNLDEIKVKDIRCDMDKRLIFVILI